MDTVARMTRVTPDAATVSTKLNLLYSAYGSSRHAPASQQEVRLGGPRGAALGAAVDYGVGSLALVGTPPVFPPSLRRWTWAIQLPCRKVLRME